VLGGSRGVLEGMWGYWRGPGEVLGVYMDVQVTQGGNGWQVPSGSVCM
jgi:hypothetical protein